MTALAKIGLKPGNTLRKTRNADVPWDAFTPETYKDLHYSSVRRDDRKILELVRDFFVKARIPTNARGIDVGSGPNLYPTLSMLPFCSQITMLDISRSNVGWLRRQQLRPDASWQKFWNVLTHERAYRELDSYKDHLRRNTKVEQGSIFDLSQRRYHVGTMFFVAESLSNYFDEFSHAMRCFLGSLHDDAPFAIAFMRGSVGYTVNGVPFPAVAIDEVDVKDCLDEAAAEICSLTNIAVVTRFRDGYEGMTLATGRAAVS